jgi:hypothetical protein
MGFLLMLAVLPGFMNVFAPGAAGFAPLLPFLLLFFPPFSNDIVLCFLCYYKYKASDVSIFISSSRTGIQFVFQQAAIDGSVVKLYSAFGFQANFFSKLHVVAS